MNYTPLGKRLRHVATEHELTLIQLARIMEVQPQHLSDIMAGRSRAMWPRIVRIAEALGVSLDYLAGLSATMQRPGCGTGIVPREETDRAVLSR